MILSLLSDFSLISAGFSIVAACLLWVCYAGFINTLPKSLLSVTTCASLMLALGGLQLGHFELLLVGQDPLSLSFYRISLFSVPTFFYFFCRTILLPVSKTSPWMLIHFAPLLCSFFVPIQAMMPLTFLVGAGYCCWFTQLIYGMRAQHKRFKFELFFFAFFSVVAVLVLVFGLLLPYLDIHYFYLFYTNAIGLAFFLVLAALIVFPELMVDLVEAATISYASSTLGGVDKAAKLALLKKATEEQKVHHDDALSLASLAETLSLSSHQLSELINSHFGFGFSRYIRELRVKDAQGLLLSEPNSSILAVAMAVGFKSQSSFYSAFKEVAGESPGSYRKRLLAKPQ